MSEEALQRRVTDHMRRAEDKGTRRHCFDRRQAVLLWNILAADLIHRILEAAPNRTDADIRLALEDIISERNRLREQQSNPQP